LGTLQGNAPGLGTKRWTGASLTASAKLHDRVGRIRKKAKVTQDPNSSTRLTSGKRRGGLNFGHLALGGSSFSLDRCVGARNPPHRQPNSILARTSALVLKWRYDCMLVCRGEPPHRTLPEVWCAQYAMPCISLDAARMQFQPATGFGSADLVVLCGSCK
jgi:hypothetical protein